MDVPSKPLWQISLAWLALGALLCCGAWLRVQDFDESFWLDELHTAWCVVGELGDVAPRAMQGNQSPLAYWLLWGWVQIAGVSEWSLRGPSLVASLAAIVAVFVALRRWTKSYIAALVAAFALAIEPYSIFYGGEARVYAWVELLAILHVMLFFELLTRGVSEDAMREPSSPTLWVGVDIAWMLVGVLLFYVHYTAALLFVAEGVLVVLVGCTRPIKWLPLVCCAHPTWRRIFVDFALLLMLCLPAVGHLREIAARRENWALFVERPTWLDLWHAIPQVQVLGGTLLMVVSVVLFRWGTKMSPCWRTSAWLVGALIGGWFTVPLLLTWLLSYAEIARLFHVRYFLVSLPAMACLLGWLVSLLPTAKLQMGALPIVLALLLVRSTILADYVVDPELRPRRNEGWREVVEWINNSSYVGKITLVSGLIEANGLRTSDDAALREYCSYPLRSAYPVRQAVTIEPLPATNPWELTSDQAHRYWESHRRAHSLVVVRGDSNYQSQFRRNFLKGLIHPDYRLLPRSQMGDVTAYRLMLLPSSKSLNLDNETRTRLQRFFPEDSQFTTPGAEAEPP